jgi:hypothetical protein
MIIRQFKQIIMAAAFAAAIASAQTTTTGTVTETSNTPAVGLASTETAQINLLNTASNASSGTAASCTGTVTFLNSSGKAIGSASNFTVTSGEIQSVSLPFASSGATTTRTEIRATISRTITLNSGVPCNLQITLETYDTGTGVTHVYVPNAASSGIGIVAPVIGTNQPH